MVKHIVLFKIKNKGNIQKGIEALKSMKGKIDGLIDLEAGVDFLKSDRSYDIALITTHTDKAALDFYQAHEVHQPVKKLMHEIRESSVSVDYEM
ncbi:MAG: Dabb family protein [Firmicutes bacterium]|nr:Dabb family protein [Bacillota bacterium]